MQRPAARRRPSAALCGLALGLLFPAAELGAQTALYGAVPEFLSRSPDPHEIVLDEPLLDVVEPYVLVHLETNRVYLMDGARSVWSAPAGTGTGFRLAGGGQRWTFTTPRGTFRVRRKEKDPIWIAPDWYFVENGRAIPADNHPSRRMAGVMGTTAIYLGDGIAIHGTNSPGLVLNPDPEKRRVSHGCIRLTNEAARELYHMIGVGTPVLVF